MATCAGRCRSRVLSMRAGRKVCRSCGSRPGWRRSMLAPAPERIPVGVPHGGFINHVAVTEPGDAAVSLENIGGLRLWPTLDGSREPVPFTVNGAAAVALSPAGKELLVGVRDEAGAVQL